MRVIGAQGRTSSLEKEHFDKHFMYTTYKWRAPQEKKSCFFSKIYAGKVDKMASKAKTLNICAVDPNWKWIHDDVILRRKNDSHDATPNFNQHWSY